MCLRRFLSQFTTPHDLMHIMICKKHTLPISVALKRVKYLTLKTFYSLRLQVQNKPELRREKMFCILEWLYLFYICGFLVCYICLFLSICAAQSAERTMPVEIEKKMFSRKYVLVYSQSFEYYFIFYFEI